MNAVLKQPLQRLLALDIAGDDEMKVAGSLRHDAESLALARMIASALAVGELGRALRVP